MFPSVVCMGDPNVYGEVILDELLAEPIVRLVMARDGVDARSIRDLASSLARDFDFVSSGLVPGSARRARRGRQTPMLRHPKPVHARSR